MRTRTLKQLAVALERYERVKRLPTRAIALTLCVSILLPMLAIQLATPTQASGSGGVDRRTLYTREADKNTMDSYVQASLGGFIYTQRSASGGSVDAVTTPTVRNNYGSRYAGEIWADLSVFARYQPNIGEIRPFEAGHAYSAAGVGRALGTLPTDIKWNTIEGFNSKEELEAYLMAGNTLTVVQAEKLNEAANESVQRYYTTYNPVDPHAGYAFAGDGDFDGQTLQLERHTDGVTSCVKMNDDSDFMHVFSALGSSEVVDDSLSLPLDVVFVLDTSSTMADTGTEKRLYQASLALNGAFDAVLKNPNNRVALLTYDTNVEEYMPLDRYVPLSWDADDNGIYFIGNDKFTDKEGGFFDPHFDSKDPPSLVRNNEIRGAKYYGSRAGTDKTYKEEYLFYHRSQFVQINAKSAAAEIYGTGRVPSNRLAATASVFVNYKGETPPYSGAGNTGNLTVNNVVLGEAKDPVEKFTFIVKLSDPINDTYNGVSFVNGEASFTLGHNESKTMELPAGISYEVTQQDANKWEVSYYTSTAAGGRGIISENSTSTAVFVNYGYTDDKLLEPKLKNPSKEDYQIIDATGNFVVLNTVIDAGKEFHFTVKLSDSTINGTYGDMDFENGIATFALRDAEYKVAKNLPAGITYTVTETDANQDGYTTEDHYKEYTEWFSVHAGTNTHQGLYEGLKMLLEERETTSRVETAQGTKDLQRIPVVVLLSDGEPSYVTTSDTADLKSRRGSGQDKNNGVDLQTGVMTDWWAPENPAFQASKTENREHLIGYPSGAGWGNALPILLMAAHMKQNVNKHYFNDVSPQNYPGVQVITVGIDTPAVGDELRQNLMRTTLDPKGQLTGDPDKMPEYTKSIYNAVQYYLDRSKNINDLKLTVDEWDHWATIERAPADGTVYPITWERVLYNDRYLEAVTDANQQGERLEDVLIDIIEGLRILGEAFAPISGTNASGVPNSMTYTNPIGNYMKVDGVTDVTLFGEHYKAGKRAEYNYTVNQAIIAQGNIQAPGLIKEGWYSESVDNGEVTYHFEGTKKEVDDRGIDGWAEGWTYRVTYQTAEQYVPTLEDSSEGDLTPKERNTTYVLYSIIGRYQKVDSDNVNEKWKVDSTKPAIPIPAGTSQADMAARTVDNPCYTGADKVTFDLLEDIKIWVENTGSYRDVGMGDNVLDAGYSEALFVNISTNALPLQVARIGYDKNGNLTYKTNLNDTWESTPLRVYYNVSFDPLYLRYNGTDVVGVAMSDMSSEYLKNNTGTNFTVNGVKNENNRYTAFYSNYYTFDEYDEYPVLSDQNKKSRGNPSVTFSVGKDNQFYRFQKNRVLYVIPGSFGLDSRPAEIDLGDLSDTYIVYKKNGAIVDRDAEGAEGEIVAKGTPGAKLLDPTNFKDLLTALNAKRGNLDGNGSKSTYWCFGDCVAVDGGDIIDDKDSFEDRILEIPEKDRNEIRARQQTFKGKLAADNGRTVQPQISSDNWYYIVREFYYPIFEGSESGDADRVEVHYTAIARKGSEFGSGLANGGGMGSQIEWYNPKTNGTKDFKDDAGGHYGYPGEDNDIKNLPGNAGHMHTGDWYVSARPGGLRVGGMANFAGVKGYDIRGGVGEGYFITTEERIGRANVSERALTYFLPTISSFAANPDDAVINLYLGNNGRILVADTLLLVTKLVKDTDGNYDLTSLTEFSYTVTIEDFTGVRSAVKVIWDKEAGTWRRVIGAIKAVTNNDGLLLSGSDHDVPAQVGYSPTGGVIRGGSGYYIYVEDGSGAVGSAVVYDYGDGDGNHSVGIKKQDGNKIEFLTTVYLVSVGAYNNGSWTNPNNRIMVQDLNIATMDADSGANNSDITLRSDYNIDPSYLSESLNFGSQNTAAFTLKSGEGLLFNGIGNDDKYRVTETLSREQVEKGWEFLSVNEQTESKTVDGYTYDLDDTHHEYTVSGTTGVRETAVHYLNFTPYVHIVLEGVKILTATPEGSATLTAGQFTFELSAEGNAPMPEGATGPVTVTNKADGTFAFDQITFTEPGIYEYKIREAAPPDPDKAKGYTYDEDTVYTVAVEVTKATGGKKGFVANVSIYDNEGGEVSGVVFKNLYNKPVDLTISKIVTGVDSNLEDEFPFTVKLTAPEGVKLDSTYNCALTQSGVTQSKGTVAVDGGGNVTLPTGRNIVLKHGQTITIQGLPAGTSYTVEEDNGGYYTIVNDVVVKVIVASGTVPDDANVRFVNTSSLGGIFISKTVNGDGVDPNKEFTFTVTLTDGNGKPLEGEYACSALEDKVLKTDKDGKAEITLRHNQTVQIEKIPPGTNVTVTESPEGGFGMTVKAVGTGGNKTGKEVDHGITVVVPAGENQGVIISFVNQYANGGLSINKTVTGADGNTTQYFTFTVTLDSDDGYVLNGSYNYTGNVDDRNGDSIEDGKITFKQGLATVELKHDQNITITGLPAGIGYTVTESDNDGYTVKGVGTTGTIPENAIAAAEFTNDRTPQEPNLGNLTVIKTVTGTAGDRNKEFHFTVTLNDRTVKGTYGGMAFVNGVAEFTLKDGERKTATGLPAGITYMVTETEANQDGYATTSTGSIGKIPANGTAVAAFVNDKSDASPSGNLTVSKTVTGNAGDRDKEFHFTVTLSDRTINGAYGGMTFMNGVAEFTLKDGERKTATGLPPGVTYTVTETESNQGGYTTTYTGSTGRIPANGTAAAAFVNDKTDDSPSGSLTVSKTVTGNAGDRNKEFHFTVTLSDRTINGAYGGMTFVNGVAEFTLKDGERKTATGLPPGITYTVTETEANQGGYTTTYTGSTGRISANGTAVAAFVNDKSDASPPGKLIVSKTVTGTAGDRNKEFHFTVTLSDRTINGAYGGMIFVNGVAEFTLKDSESKTATGLPPGITYTVTETEANQGGYTTTSTGSSGSISINGTAAAAFINDKTDDFPGDLTVSKTVTGTVGERNKQFHFTVKLSDLTINGTYGDVTFVNGVASFTLKHRESITIRNLPAGIAYTVTETEANQNGYTTSALGEYGTIMGGEHGLASFVNNKDDPDIPKTGDESQFVLWLVLMSLCWTGMLVSLVYTIGRIKAVCAKGGKRLVKTKGGKRLKK